MDAAISHKEILPTSSRIFAAAGLAAAAVGSFIVWYFDPVRSGLFPVCPLYSLTGFACPGCGLTRGFHALLHGDVLTALDFNALIPVFAVIFAGILLSLASVAIRGRGLVQLNAAPKLIVGLFVLMIVFGVLRNLPYYPFSVLYP